MAAILVLSLFLSLLVGLILVGAAVLEVAFSSAPGTMPGSSRALRITAQRGTDRKGFLFSNPQRPDAHRPDKSNPSFDFPTRKNSAARCHSAGEARAPIRVTPPEALAIATYLRANKPREEYDAIATRACENVDAQRFRSCALWGAEGNCAAYSVRPIWCHFCALCQKSATDPLSEPFGEMILEAGKQIEQGLSAGLQLAELDGETYELNSALTVAMTRADAVEEWARGGDLFRSCAKC